MAVIQIVRFRTKAGVDEAAFLKINERFQHEIAPKLPGLTRREATRGADGEWLLVLRYKDMTSAKASMQSDTSEVSGALMSMLDMSSMSAAFYEIVTE